MIFWLFCIVLTTNSFVILITEFKPLCQFLSKFLICKSIYTFLRYLKNKLKEPKMSICISCIRFFVYLQIVRNLHDAGLLIVNCWKSICSRCFINSPFLFFWQRSDKVYMGGDALIHQKTFSLHKKNQEASNTMDASAILPLFLRKSKCIKRCFCLHLYFAGVLLQQQTLHERMKFFYSAKKIDSINLHFHHTRI